MQTKKIIVGSNNPVKIASALAAYTLYVHAMVAALIPVFGI